MNESLRLTRSQSVSIKSLGTVMSTYLLCDVKVFGKCTNVKLVYWIIPAISKTVYKLTSKFGHPWLNPFLYPIYTDIYAWTQNLDGQTDRWT